jgi:hypothetical protein
MNQRLTAITALTLALVLAAFVMVRQTPAQSPAAANKGIFSSLKVGQLVEIDSNQIGSVIRTYEDAANKERMTARLTEIGADYLVAQVATGNAGEIMEVRLPLTSLSSIIHLKSRKGSGKKGE